MKGIITEEEYQSYEERKLRETALRFREILRTIPLADIAMGTGLKWDTVNRLREGKRISFKALCRIERYIQSKGLML